MPSLHVSPIEAHLAWSDVWAVPFHTPFERLGPNNNEFCLRFYVPRDAHLPYERVFVLLNGLGESDVHIYDALGDAFAEHGVPCVLLPLPNHFCRWGREPGAAPEEHVLDNDPYHFRREVAFRDVTENIKRRLLDQNQNVLVDGFHQTLRDVRKLIHSLKANRAFLSAENRDFFEKHFSGDTRVSLYGYSLGGLLALAALLRDPHLLSFCGIVNSGASIQDIRVPSLLFSPTEWEEVQLNAYRGLEPRREDERLSDDLRELYTWIFLGNDRILLRRRLESESHRLLCVIGASDEVFQRGQILDIEPRQTGLAVMQVPRLGHWIGVEREDRPVWQLWKSLIVRTILAFEKDRPRGFAPFLDITHAHLAGVAPQERLALRLLLWDRDESMLRKEAATGNLGDPGSQLPLLARGVEAAVYEEVSGPAEARWVWRVEDIETPSSLAWAYEDTEAAFLRDQGFRTVGAGPVLLKAGAHCLGVIAVFSNLPRAETVLTAEHVEAEAREASATLAWLIAKGPID